MTTADFQPFVFLRGGKPYKVTTLKGNMPWLMFWDQSGQWCLQHALPLQDEIDELRALAVPDAQAAWYETEQRRRHPHHYHPDGSVKK